MVQALQRESPGIEVFGIGGAQMERAGFKKIKDTKELLVMGFIEVLFHLPRIFKILNEIVALIQKEKPDVIVLLDYPGFHFRLAKKLQSLSIEIPRVYYIPPKIWVWRKKRAEFLRKYFQKILLIFPFEKKFYQKLNLPAVYVGNPLLDELPLDLSQKEARKKLHLENVTDPLLILMPGSRPSEIKEHLNLMLDSAESSSKKLSRRFQILLPFPENVDLKKMKELILAWKVATQSSLDIHVYSGQSAICLRAADFGLIKSGTSTLEAGLLNCPHVIVYQGHPLSLWIFKHIVRYTGPVGLINLVYGQLLVPEILGHDLTVERLVDELSGFVLDKQKSEAMKLGFQKVREQLQLENGVSPSQRAAQEILLAHFDKMSIL